MPDPLHAVQYFLFMKWFKKKYPMLFNQYQLHIMVPTQSDEIAITLHSIDPADVTIMESVIKEYYSSVKD